MYKHVCLRTMALVMLLIAVTSVAACGGTSNSSPTVAKAGKVQITSARLSHWMRALVGSDLYDATQKRAPAGLISNPPDYAACAASVAALAPKRARTSLSRVQREAKCRELHRAIAHQALSFLITSEWRIQEGLEHGIRITEGEITAMIARIEAEQFPHAHQYETYVSSRSWTLSDERFEAKLNLINAKLIAALERQKHARGVNAVLKILAANAATQRAKTSCKPAYVVPECQQYKAPRGAAEASPAVLLEDVTRGQ